MISKIIILALGFACALACTTLQDYNSWKNYIETTKADPTDACDGSVCLDFEECATKLCSDPPTVDEITKWIDDQSKGNFYDLRLGTCGKKGLGTGAIIGIVIGAVVLVGAIVGGIIFYRRKKAYY